VQPACQAARPIGAARAPRPCVAALPIRRRDDASTPLTPAWTELY